ncbi:T9SS type A sorting domain-containing protein [candidate division KSB1 bacterium]|nr:T9SS type A sorting domain-containing protein [candidate division KSB1 bacterium]
MNFDRLKTFLFIVLSVIPWGKTFSQLDPRFHTLEEIYSELDSLSTLYPGIMKWDTIGISTQDSLPIWAVKISDSVEVEEDEPAVLNIGQHHAEEVLGVEICMKMIGDLVTWYGSPTFLTRCVNELEIWFVPTMNPEGHLVVTDTLDLTYRKNKRDNNENGIFDYRVGIGWDIDGVDPNRNYDFNWIHGDTLYQGDYDYYRGPYPFSELENQAIRDLAVQQNFVLSIAYHSARSSDNFEKVFYSWNWEGKHPPDYGVIQDIAYDVAGLIVNESGTGHYQPSNSESRRGHAHDWFYTATGAIQFLIECGTNNLQPDSALIEDTIERNIPGAEYLMRRILGYGETSGAQLTGIISDAQTGQPLKAEVQILGATGDVLKPRYSDPRWGRYRRLLLPGSYTLRVFREGYQEAIIPGIVVNETDPTVRNVTLEPLPWWDLAGTVQDAASGNPLGARLVFRGNKADTVFSNPVTGAYSISLPQSPYSVLVTADGCVPFADSMVLGQDTVIAFTLSRADALFWDDFEDGLSRWTTGGTGSWGLAQSDPHSPMTLLTDSPRGEYENLTDAWVALTQGIDLSPYTTAALSFWHRYYLEYDYDFGYVEISTDNGHNWAELAGPVGGIQLNWTQMIIPLDGYCGDSMAIKIRFRLVTDSTLTEDGWAIDDVLIVGGTGGSLIPDRGDPTPLSFRLEQNFPNPFNSTTVIRYQIPSHSWVSLKVYNIKGQEVATLLAKHQNTGRHQINWDGIDLASGIYFFRLEAGDFVQTKKSVLLK